MVSQLGPEARHSAKAWHWQHIAVTSEINRFQEFMIWTRIVHIVIALGRRRQSCCQIVAKPAGLIWWWPTEIPKRQRHPFHSRQNTTLVLLAALSIWSMLSPAP